MEFLPSFWVLAVGACLISASVAKPAPPGREQQGRPAKISRSSVRIETRSSAAASERRRRVMVITLKTRPGCDNQRSCRKLVVRAAVDEAAGGFLADIDEQLEVPVERSGIRRSNACLVP